jgi:hypothetical protein
MKPRLRFAGVALIVVVVSSIAIMYGTKCWDAVVIRLIDDRIAGYSQGTYNTAIAKIQSVDPLIGYIRSRRMQNAERMRNEGRRFVAEYDADHRDESFLACIKLRYFVLCDLQFGNVRSHEIAACLESFKDKGAYHFGCQMQQEDIKKLYQHGSVDQSQVEQVAQRIRMLENEMTKGEHGGGEERR